MAAITLSLTPLPVRRSAAAKCASARSAFTGRCLALPLAPVARAPRSVAVRATYETEKTEVDVDQIVKDLQTKWDRVENKTSVAVYVVGAVVALWLSSTLVSAVNSVPLLPKLLELVGLGYTAWFVYRYLLFKSSREELKADVEELKKKISGAVEESGTPPPPSFETKSNGSADGPAPVRSVLEKE